MIDLSKNQLVEGDVKVRVWNCQEGQAVERYLYYINHNCASPFGCWGNGKTAKESAYKPGHISLWKNAKLIKLKYKVKKFCDLVAVLKEQGYFPGRNNLSCLSADYYKLFFCIDMFKYCGKDPDENEYIWHKDWLEEVED